MMIDYTSFCRHVTTVQARVSAAARSVGRDPATIRLLPVTKNHPPEAAGYVARFGLPAVGENRVQEGVAKRALVAAPLQWELIGHLQSNKAKVAASGFDRIQSVDSEKLVRLLDRASADLGKILPILLQVNAGDDPAKFGVAAEDAPRLLETALAMSHLRVDGLMTIAPLSDDPTVARRAFARLREIRDDLARRSGRPLAELSMGMTDDLESAVSEGSTLVRVGTALFGERE
jgi:PLP dependent protein